VNTLTGEYFDGRHPVGVAGTLVLSDRFANLTSEPYSSQYEADSLSVSPRIGRSARFISFPDGGQLQCDDSPLLDVLPQESATEGAVAWLERRWSTALIATVLTAALLALGYVYGLPRMAEYAVARIPIQAEVHLGEQALRQLDSGGWFKPTALSAQEQQQIRAGFLTLVDGLPLEKSYNLQFRSGARIGANALALPGGTLVITDELVRLTDSPEEVMAVLAHEIGHVELRHTLRQVLQDSLVDAVVATLTGDSLTSGMPMALAKAQYSREFETQADEYAFALLKRHHISPSRFADLLERLEARSGSDNRGTTFLDSHPPTPERILRARAA
jgi:predicted Zn-dependent protease